MIRLNLTQKPEWVDLLPGLRLHLAPMSTALMVAARSDAEVAGLDGSASRETQALTMAKAVARLAVLEWEGVGDEGGEVVEVSLEGVDALLDIWPVFETFQEKYLTRGLLMDAEGNVSARSQNGTSAVGPDTATRAVRPAKTARSR